MATLIGLGLCIDDLTSTFSSASAPPIKAGTIVEGDTGRWKFVYNYGSTTITQYYPAIRYGTSTPGYGCAGDNSTVITNNILGIAMTAIASSEYGWVKCGGVMTCRVSTTATAGYACSCIGTYLKAAAATNEMQVGVVVYGTAAAGTAIVDLKIA